MPSLESARNKRGFLRAQALRREILAVMSAWPGGLAYPCTAPAVLQRLAATGRSPLPSVRTVRLWMADIRLDHALAELTQDTAA